MSLQNVTEKSPLKFNNMIYTKQAQYLTGSKDLRIINKIIIF